MSDLSRRAFLKNAATSAAAASLLSAAAFELHGNPLGLPIGCQTWPVRDGIAKDFPGTIQQLAAAGFQNIELCSPVGYDDSGFGGLAKYKGSELRKMLNDWGVGCISSHFGIEELRKDQPSRIAWAQDLGLKQMIVPSLEWPKEPHARRRENAPPTNTTKMGENAAKAGIQQGLHNEGFELSKVNGKRTYDLLLELLDPKLVKFQFQVSTISEGFDAAEYFLKYPGRFISMHVQGWSAPTNKKVAVGPDNLDWKKILTAAKNGGVQNYFVEMNLELMKASVPYLQNLQV